MHILTRISAVVFLFCHTAYGATWYASASGSSTNGSTSAPWGILYAVTNANPYLQPGDTVKLLSGEWDCNETNMEDGETAPCLNFRKSGTPTDKITYEANTLWGFSFDGGLVFPSSSSNIVLRFCRVYYSANTNRNRLVAGSHPGGIEEYGPGNEFLHNLLENCGTHAIGTWSTTRGKLIAGNIMRFCGNYDWTGTWNGEPRGGGMYAQNLNDSSTALIQGNISYYNHTVGLGASSNKTNVWDFQFRYNIVALAHQGGIWGRQDDLGWAGIKIETNCFWHNANSIRLGWVGNGPHTNAVVVGNYGVDGDVLLWMRDGWLQCTITNNTWVNLTNRYLVSLEKSGEVNGDVTSHTINWNTYSATNTGPFGAGQFGIKELGYVFADWKTATTEDGDSTCTYVLPTENVIRVFQPSTDPNFVHVAVYNWANSASATVDLSAYFAANDRLDIYDAQNIPVVCSSVVFDGSSPVTLPLNLTDKAAMLGSFPELEAWNGFDPRFRAFVIHKNNPTNTVRSTTLRLGNLKGR